MFGRLGALLRRRERAARDPAAELERERRLAEAERDRDELKDSVLETEQRRQRREFPGFIHLP